MKNNETIYTGFTELDNLTGGFKKGELILISGRPDIGKLAFVLDIKGSKHSLLYINDTLPQRKDIEKEWQLWYRIPFSIDMLIISNLEHIKCNTARNKKEEIRKVLKGLKNLATELNIPVVVISQLSKKVENREDKHPIVADLRDSSMNEIPDKILFIYRDDYYGISNSEGNNIAEIIIAKNSNGETGTVKLLFDKNEKHFKNT